MPRPSSLVLYNGTTVLYNGTLPLFVNSTMTAFGLTVNSTFAAAAFAGFNQTAALFANVSSTAANATAGAGYGWQSSLFAPNVTLSAANETMLLMATSAFCASRFHLSSSPSFVVTADR